MLDNHALSSLLKVTTHIMSQGKNSADNMHEPILAKESTDHIMCPALSVGLLVPGMHTHMYEVLRQAPIH